MPNYQWVCDCGEEIVVSSKMDERDVPPQDGCPKCGNRKMRREAFHRPSSPKGFRLLGDTGWHHCEYTKYRGVR